MTTNRSGTMSENMDMDDVSSDQGTQIMASEIEDDASSSGCVCTVYEVSAGDHCTVALVQIPARFRCHTQAMVSAQVHCATGCMATSVKALRFCPAITRVHGLPGYRQSRDSRRQIGRASCCCDRAQRTQVRQQAACGGPARGRENRCSAQMALRIKRPLLSWLTTR